MISRGSFFSQNNESPRNADRVRWAASTMGNFAKITGVGEDLQADSETVLADMLADLMHWCDARRTNRHQAGTVDFQSALKRARDHYQHEFAKEGEERLAGEVLDRNGFTCQMQYPRRGPDGWPVPRVGAAAQREVYFHKLNLKDALLSCQRA